MNVRLPQPPNLQGALGQHLTALNAQISKVMQSVASSTEPVSHVLIKAPNGNSYKVSVDNTGTLTATAV